MHAATKIHRRQRRRERIMRNLAKAVFIAFIVIAIALLYGHTQPQYRIVNYKYQSCNQLWDLTQYCPDDMDKLEYIALIMQLNGMDDMTVYSDRLYQVPIYEK